MEVTPLAVGCWAWGDEEYWNYQQDHGPRDVVEAFDASIEAGLDFFDTAEAYAWGKSEKIVGWLARKSGRPLVLATKYAPLAGRGGPGAIRKGILGSLKRLGVPRIDLYQLHWADTQELPIAAAMDAFAEAVKDGLVGAVGVSNFRAREMEAAHEALARHGVPLATNQVHYSLLHRAPEVDGVLDSCRALGVTLLAYSPLEQGLLTGKYDTARPPMGQRAQAAAFAPTNVAAAQPVLARLRAIAATHGVDAAAVALAWLLAKPGVVPIAGAKTGDQAKRNARALEVVLSAVEVDELDAATNGWCAAA